MFLYLLSFNNIQGEQFKKKKTNNLIELISDSVNYYSIIGTITRLIYTKLISLTRKSNNNDVGNVRKRYTIAIVTIIIYKRRFDLDSKSKRRLYNVSQPF